MVLEILFYWLLFKKPGGRAIFTFVCNVCARFAFIMGVALLLPALSDWSVNDADWVVFIRSSFLIVMVSTLILLATWGASCRFSARLGFLLTACLWGTAILLGAIPLYFSHLSLSFAQAIFEAASGVTTTGGTVLTKLDAMPHGILLWRSLLCWIGGIGFIALALLLLPSLRLGGVRLFHMESLNKSEKVLPRVNQVANGIMLAYFGLTILCMLSYFAAGMTPFDAVNHAMTTVSTAGFSTHDASIGYFHNHFIMVIAIVFMVLSALPFALYIKLLFPTRLRRQLDPQIVLFFGLMIVISLILAAWLRFFGHLSFFEAVLNAFFHFVSVLTTTGYATQDYALWGPLAFGIFFLACFIGGCSGSTSGGIKINRLIILYRLSIASMTRLLLPHRVVQVRYGNSDVSGEVSQNVLLFLCLFMVSLVVGTMLLVTTGLDFVSALTGALTALSNIGPGFGDYIGPVGNFSVIPDSALWIFSFLMLAGRLEIVTIVVLFIPAFWQR